MDTFDTSSAKLTSTIKEDSIDSKAVSITDIEDEVFADELYKQFQIKKTSLIIHAFAVAHGTTTLTLGSGLDTIPLTIETTAMLYSILKTNNFSTNLSLSAISSVLGSAIAGKLTGSVLGTLARVFFPGGGEALDRAINVPATIITTEILGWGAFALISFLDNNTISSEAIKKTEISEEDKKLIKATATKYKKEYSAQGKELYKKMSKADKETFKVLMKKLQTKDADDNTRMQITDEIMTLLGQYFS